MTFKIVALGVIAFLLATDYVMLVIASRAEEKAKRMERAWKEKCDEQIHRCRCAEGVD